MKLDEYVMESGGEEQESKKYAVSTIVYVPDRCIICGSRLEHGEIISENIDEHSSYRKMIVGVQRVIGEMLLDPKIKRVNVGVVSDSMVRVEAFAKPEGELCNKFWICPRCYTEVWRRIREDVRNSTPKIRCSSKEELIETLRNVKDIIIDVAKEIEQKILDGKYTKDWKVEKVLDLVWAEHLYEIEEWKQRVDGAVLGLVKMVVDAIVIQAIEKGINVTFEEVWKEVWE